MHEQYMQLALQEARKAFKKNEAPIGAVIVKDGKIIARAHNLRERGRNALYHAEILAVKRACRKLRAWRLSGCDVYVTLEPCPMCAGALLQARVDNLYFGAHDPKNGACGSVVNLLSIDGFNHKINVISGILADECGGILTDFFRKLREKH